jgi:hypothetical protein
MVLRLVRRDLAGSFGSMRTNIAAALIIGALVAELVGIVLIVLEARRAGHVWQDFLALNTSDDPQRFTYAQAEGLGPVVTMLLTAQARRWTAVTLLVVGVVLGAAGDLLSLG